MIKYFTIEDLLKHYLQKKFHILEKEDLSFKMNERSSFILKLTCDENFNCKL